MQTILFLNSNGANVAVTGVGITVSEPNSERHYVEPVIETTTKNTVFGGTKTTKAEVSEGHWVNAPSVTKDSLLISSAGQGYRGSGAVEAAPNVTFKDYAEALTTAVAKATPNVVIDLRPAQQRNSQAPQHNI